MQTDNSKLRGRQPVVCLLPLRQPAAAVAAADAAVAADSVHQLVLCVRDDSVELWEWRGQQESFIWSQDLFSTVKQQVCVLVACTSRHIYLLLSQLVLVLQVIWQLWSSQDAACDIRAVWSIVPLCKLSTQARATLLRSRTDKLVDYKHMTIISKRSIAHVLSSSWLQIDIAVAV
jgi:hypothetical protein